jgi:hypothetical protein
MRVFVWVDVKRYEIGTPEFFHCFFSTICVRLEEDQWGSVFPGFMLEFYTGRLSHRKAQAALEELDAIREGLEALPPNALVWDYDDLDRLPPWDDDASDGLTSAAEYFFTSAGASLFETLREAFECGVRTRQDVRIVKS